MKKCALYVRVSTERQDYERQVNELHEYCKLNKLKVAYEFCEKLSGAVDERAEFLKLQKLTREDIDAVIALELSRLGRTMSTVVKVVEEFSKKQICVITLKENFRSLDSDGNMTPSTIMMLGFCSAMAQVERSTIKERTLSGKRQRILSGNAYSGTPPFGYIIKDKKMYIDESKREMVEQIFAKYKEGKTIDFISKTFNIPQRTVHNILTNETYAGRHWSNVTQSYVETPAIISKELFNEVKRMRESNRIILRKANSNNDLRGKMICPHCHRTMSLHGGSKNANWQCPVCHSRISDKSAHEALNLMLEEYGRVSSLESINEENMRKLRAMMGDASDMSDIVDNLLTKIDEEKKKLEVLKDVFSASQLKTEVRRIKMLEAEYEKQEAELQSLMGRIAAEEERFDLGGKVSVENVSRIEVVTTGRFEKELLLYINKVYSGVKCRFDFSNRNKIKIEIL